MDGSEIHTLNLADLRPHLRGANLLETDELHFGPRVNYASQWVYVFAGRVTALVGDERWELSPGTLIHYGPGQRHEVYAAPGDTVRIGTVCFSWTVPSTASEAMKNTSTPQPTGDFWRKADPPVRIQGLPDFPAKCTLPVAQRAAAERLLTELITAFRQSAADGAGQLLARARFLEWVDLWARLTGKEEHSRATGVLERFAAYIAAEYTRPLRRCEVAAALHISESYLTALLRRHLQTNLTDYLKKVRLDAALNLLQHTDLRVKEIARRVGFQDCSYFVLTFRRFYGMPPQQARERGVG